MRRLLLALPLLLWCSLASAQTAPVLFFTDLTSGPATGNSDSTFNTNGGAYVALYGNFLGGGTVTLNGASCLTTVAGPSPYLWYQKWVVQLTSGCSTGNFVVTTAAGTSNGLAFTVRSGNIYYVSTTGSDGGSGSFSSPWATMAKCVQTMAAEGICYVENGVATGGNLDSGGWGALSLRQTWCGAGTNGYPRAIITYPGATATIGTTSGFGLVSTDTTAGDGACVGYWTVAGFTIRAGPPSDVAVSLNGPAFPSGSSNWRIIGTDESCPNCNGSSSVLHTLQLGGSTNTNKFFGNNVHDSGACLGSPCYPDDQYHGIYISDNSRHFELGWNSVSNIVACRGIQIYSNFNDEYDVSIHDNTIHDTTCDAIVLATLDPSQGAVTVYNNVMYHVGIGPQNLTEGGGSFDCIYHDRHLQSGSAGSGQISVYNNSCYDSGSVSNSSYQSCNSMAAYNISNNDDTTTMLIQNNIGYQTYTGNSFCATGVPYFFNGTSNSSALFGTKNLFFGVTAPTSNSVITGSITSNPSFVNTSDSGCPGTCPVDLHLSTSGSPANGAGSVSSPVPTYDHDGVIRPSPPSVGAYEFLASVGTYFAQNAVGAGNGTDCADAYAYNDGTHGWNVAANWVAGNTLHICGTVTIPTNTTGMTAAGSGTSGSPITVLFETGAILQSARFNGGVDGPAGGGPSEGGAIDIPASRSFIIIDGGTNGIIQNTANGTGLANSADSLGIWAGGDNYIIRNLTVRNIYNRIRGTTTGTGGSSGDIMVTGGATSVKICNNTLNNASLGAELNFHVTPTTPGITSWTNPASCQSNAFTAGAVFGNNTLDDHNWMSHVNGSGAPVIINNQWGPIGWSNWNGDTADFHQDGFFTVGNSSATFKPYFINNYMPGDQNQGSPSGMILYTDDGHASSGQGQSSVAVGNIFYGTGGGITCCMAIGIQAVVTGNPKGPYQWYNNTFVNFSKQIDDFAWLVASPTMDDRNNLWYAGNASWFYANENAGWSFGTATINGNSYFGGRAPGSPSGPFGLWTGSVGIDYPHWLTSCVAGSGPGALCDTNSSNSDPLLAGEASFGTGGTLTPTGFVPANNSPAATVGDNLTSQCASIPNQCASMPQTVGAGGSCGTGCIARPSSQRWTAGAFQVSSGTPVIAVSPSPANFANQNVGTTSGALTITFTNTGTANQVLATPYFTITGTNASNFSNAGTGTCTNGGTVVPSSSCTINITFTPSATGARTATLTMQGTVFAPVTLNGTGIGPVISIAPSPVAFGNQVVGTTSGGLTVTVSNTGTGTETLSTPFFTITGTNAADFAKTGGTCANAGTIAASASCTIILTFAPAAAGARTANLNISGTVNGLASITGTGTQAALTITPSPGAFGNQNVNTTSGPLTITVTNSGTASEILATPYFTLTGTNAANFANAGTGSCANGGTITASSSCTVNLTFTPSASGSRTASLNILGTVNGSDTLTGTGVAPFALLSPLSIAFSNQTTNTSSGNNAVTLTNSGTSTLGITSITLGGTDVSQFSTNGSTCGASLAPTISCTINVVFSPTTVGSKSASLVFVTTAASSPDSVALTGTGVAPAVPVLSFSPGLGAFGNQLVNTTSAPLTITVSNTGNAAEVLATPFFTLTGPNASEFARTAGTCVNGGTIAISGSCTVTLTFTPIGTGGRAAALNILGTVNGSAALSGTGIIPVIGLSPSPAAFGNQLQGTTSGPLTVTISNTGTATEVLATPYFTITGTNASNFAQSGGTCTSGGSIAASASCTILLTFTPSATGPRTATLNIQGTVNASDSLTGTGTLPVIGLAPSPAAFGNQNVGNTSSPLTVTVSNTGTATQTLSTPFFTITGANATDFARSGGTCANAGTIAASGSCTILLTFTPPASGARTATLNILGTVGATDSLTGTGVAPILSITPSPGAFGNQNVSTTSSPLTITVTNIGTAAETLNTPYFTITGTNAADFANAGTGTCANGGSIAVSASCTVNLTFTPAASGARAATLNISGTVNGTDSLTGTGVASGVLLSPTSIAFGNQTVNTSSGNHAVTLTNSGTATLNISSIALTGANAAEFSTNGSTCGSTLAAAASCTLNVVFTPTTAAAKSASLTFTTDASTSPDNVTLTGTGVVPAVPVINIAPTPGVFGNQLQGTTSAGVTFTVSNSGTASEVLATPFFTLTGANSADFARSGGTCVNAGTIAVSGSCTIILTFTPSATGSRTGTLNILGTVNASNALSGTGTFPALSFLPNPLDFGNQVQGTTSGAMTLTVTNTGTASQILATPYFTITGANPSNFANTGAGTCANGATIATSGSCTVVLTFTPSTTGALTATLNILGTTNGSSSLTGTGTPVTPSGVTLSPTTINYGNQDDGTSSPPTQVSLTNSGTGTLTITSIALTGANATEFSINTNTCGASLAPSASCTWNVVFSPATAGSKSASVTVTTNAATSPDAVVLTGTGRVPTPPNTPAPAITIVSILPPGSVVVSATGYGVTPRNVLVSTTGCSQDGINYSNPCKFSISCGNCSQKTQVRFNGTLVSTSYFKNTITASVPITLLPVPSVATDYQFSLTN